MSITGKKSEQGSSREGAATKGVAFRVLIIGGTGQVVSAVGRALAAEPSCADLMVNRRQSPTINGRRVYQPSWTRPMRGFPNGSSSRRAWSFAATPRLLTAS